MWWPKKRSDDQSRSCRPGQEPKRNSTWPPPLSGRGRYCFRLITASCCSRLAGLLKAETHAHAWFKLSTGRLRPIIALVVFSEVKRRCGLGNSTEAHHLMMVRDRNMPVQE